MDLVRRAQGGDSEALNRLFKRYYARVRRIVRLRLGRELERLVDSEDILQETFAAAVHGFDRFEIREEAGFILWLSRIAEHQIQNAAAYHRAQKRDHRREISLRPEPGGSETTYAPVNAEPCASEPAPAEALAHEEDLELIESCLSTLRSDYRDVILLRDYAGASWALVAQRLGSPTADAARSLYSRAVMELGTVVRKKTQLNMV